MHSGGKLPNDKWMIRNGFGFYNIFFSRKMRARTVVLRDIKRRIFIALVKMPHAMKMGCSWFDRLTTNGCPVRPERVEG